MFFAIYAHSQKTPKKNKLTSLLINTSFKVKNRSSERFYFGLTKGDKIEIKANV